MVERSLRPAPGIFLGPVPGATFGFDDAIRVRRQFEVSRGP